MPSDLQIKEREWLLCKLWHVCPSRTETEVFECLCSWSGDSRLHVSRCTLMDCCQLAVPTPVLYAPVCIQAAILAWYRPYAVMKCQKHVHETGRYSCHCRDRATGSTDWFQFPAGNFHLHITPCWLAVGTTRPHRQVVGVGSKSAGTCSWLLASV